MDNENQTIDQQMMVVASQYPHVVIELLKNSLEKRPLIADTEFATIINAVTLDVQSDMILKVSKLMEDIKNGSLFNKQ